jgi:alkylhydroperoxidase/carboxymuconolactone decarboxylase family protein YurZ
MARTLPDHFMSFKKAHPEVCEAFEELGRLVHESGPLSERERRLVKLGIAIGVNTEGGVHSAVRHALGGGCSPEDIEHVATMAVTTLGWPRAMAALSWVGDVVATPARKARGKTSQPDGDSSPEVAEPRAPKRRGNEPKLAAKPTRPRGTRRR